MLFPAELGQDLGLVQVAERLVYLQVEVQAVSDLLGLGPAIERIGQGLGVRLPVGVRVEPGTHDVAVSASEAAGVAVPCLRGACRRKRP